MKKWISVLLIVSLLLPLCTCGEQPAPAPAEPAPAVTEPTPAEPAPTEPAPAAPAEPEPEPVPAAPVPTTKLTGPTGKPLTEYTVAELDAETLQQATVQTALAYFRKNPYMQYDISYPTIFSTTRSGKRRLNCRNTPESVAYDTELYSSCTKYVFAVFHNAFDYEMPGYDTYWARVYDMSLEGPITLGRYGTVHEATGEADRTALVQRIKENIQPGDVVMAGPNSDNEDNAHTMLYLGDCFGDGKLYVAHSWPVGGGNLDEKTGRDNREPNGAITIQTADELWYSTGSSPNWYLDGSKSNYIEWVRLFGADDMKACHLTPSAVTRLEYPDMVITKAADGIYVYDDILPGQEITVTQTIENGSKGDYADLLVEEPIPEGAALLNAGGAELYGNVLVWNLSIPAGQSVTFTYTVKNEKAFGETLDFLSGTVGLIPTRSFSFKVGGAHLSDAQKKAMLDLKPTAIPAVLTEGGFRNLDFANLFYREILGAEISLPAAFNDYLAARFTRKNALGQEFKMLYPKAADKMTGDDAYLLQMEIPHTMTGYYVDMGGDGSVRIFDILEPYFEPGDLFITTSVDSVNPGITEDGLELYIYLGDGMAMKHSNKGTEIVPFANSVACCLMKTVFVALRPTLAYENLCK